MTRSLVHAPELLGAYPFVPLADDAAICYPLPNGAPSTSLPALLALPRLRTLSIQDTHLGDSGWAHADVKAPLHTLELGTCPHETPRASETHTARILVHPSIASCPTLTTIALSTPVSLPSAPATPAHIRTHPQAHGPPCAQTDSRFATLTALRIDPHFPVCAPGGTSESPLARTLDSLAGSPLSTVSIRCFGDDVPDVCTELAQLLGARAPGVDFLGALEEVNVHVVPDGCCAGDGGAAFEDEAGALDLLRACCGAVRLAGVLAAAVVCAAPVAAQACV